MRHLQSILLLFIMGITILPKQLVCATHLFGHAQHEHDGPSPCEIRRMAMQQPGEHLLPPMDCEYLSSVTDDYSQTQVERIDPTMQLFTVVSVVFNLVHHEITKQPLLIPPDPNCRSATLLSDSPFRAPPFG